MTLLETHGLTRDFGGLRAVDQVDFILPAGQIRGLIGPNGAGKTTFVSLLSGRLPATSGQVLFNGQDITAMPAHRRAQLGIAYTFQITSIFPDLTLRQNVLLAAQRAAGDQLPEALARDLLRRVGLSGDLDIPAGQQSYGHQRLLEIAMGLAMRPKLLILDEPTQGLSHDEISDFIALIRDVRASTTVLLIEHNIAVVMSLADRVSVLDQGRILAEGTPDEIQQNAEVRRAYLGA